MYETQNFTALLLICFTICTLSPGLKNILPITTAKVPIVKFYHVRTGLEGDISLYNTLVVVFLPPFSFFLCLLLSQIMLNNLNRCASRQPFCFQALHNTHLLASYAAIDRRVKILCYVMKVFAKVSMLHSLTHTNTHHGIILYCRLYCITVFIFIRLQMCDIGDASRGSLSSYAYTLMVLFFLQQRNPPVIPVLQEVPMTRLKLELSFFIFILIFECYLILWWHLVI